MGADPSGPESDKASVHHRFDKGLTSKFFKAVQDQIEDNRKEQECFGFTTTCAPGEELILVDFVTVPFLEFCKPVTRDEMQLNLR